MWCCWTAHGGCVQWKSRRTWRYNDFSSPPLTGLSLSSDILRSLYADTAESVVYRWIREHT
jgi:hypothetical protein